MDSATHSRPWTIFWTLFAALDAVTAASIAWSREFGSKSDLAALAFVLVGAFAVLEALGKIPQRPG